MTYRRRTTCRSCQAARLRAILDLGPMPLANALLRSREQFAGEKRWPLQLALCEACGLVQTPDVVDRAVLFGGYPYLSGVSHAMAEHFHGLARRVIERLGLVPGDRVVEIGSNDGTLLEFFGREGVRTLGIEPAANAAERARRRGVETITRFFDAAAAEALLRENGGARVVVASNVLAHVDAPVDFLVGCRTLVEGSGAGAAVVVEVPWLGDLLDRLAYDTIYHEHLCVFSVASLARIFAEAGLVLDHVERVPVHGGSLRVWGSPRRAPRTHAPAVLEWIDRERDAGLWDPTRLARFASDVEKARRDLRELLVSLRAHGSTIAACGAPAKGAVLLNACRIGPELVEFAVDKNPLKVGSWMPGMHVPILPLAALAERQPDHALLLAWNLEEEMRVQHRDWLARGGRFIVPIPRPEVAA
ncbi:MAG TPA: class I SAM-dependent methyltransferase [Planctomycetota bacterium]|nr:class I SAM-dependent methyltransferase [Planctomycetota bacterium]